MNSVFLAVGLDRVVTFIAEYLGISSVLDAVLTLLDVAIISFAVYKIIELFKGTRAVALMKGIMFLFLLAYLSRIMKLNTVSALFNIILSVLPVLAVVLFQPEFRKLLEGMGKNKLSDIFKNIFDFRDEGTLAAKNTEIQRIIDETADAVFDMSKKSIGALIVFERGNDIKEWDSQGTLLDSVVTSRLLKQIFIPNTPLHDGAVLIRKGRVYAAQCVLPLTGNTGVSRELGTRHRAAIGATEVADCVVVVVSEETGVVSFVKNGVIMRNMTGDALKSLLEDNLKEKAPVSGSRHKGLMKLFKKRGRDIYAGKPEKTKKNN